MKARIGMTTEKDNQILVFDKESPLCKLPSELDRPQLLFLDAIRYSIEMASFSHLRILATLGRISEKQSELPEDHKMLDMISALQDAWNIVDSVFRLRCLVNSVPHMKKNTPAVQLFLRATAGIQEMRNLIQHLDNEMKHLIKGDHPAWGTLGWAVVTDEANLVIESWQFMPGTIFGGPKHPIVNPLGRVFKHLIDHVELHAGNHRISISDIMEAARIFATRLEKSLSTHIDGKHRSMRDVLSAVTIHATRPDGEVSD